MPAAVILQNPSSSLGWSQVEQEQDMNRTSPFSLAGKVAAITGFGRPADEASNGSAIARLFAQQGAVIEGLDIHQADAQTTVKLIQTEGGKAHFTSGDVTDERAVKAWMAGILDRHGKIDILINNVGQSARLGPADADTKIWREQLALNLDSVMFCTRAALPAMIAAGNGAIVNISSVAGIRHLGKPQIGYNTAKAALQQFTKTSAVLHAKDGIRMNCVLPGLMFTPMVRRMANRYAGGDYDGYVAKRHAQVPMGHMGAAEDVAHAALFLASDEARYVTGTELIVDGGITATIPE